MQFNKFHASLLCLAAAVSASPALAQDDGDDAQGIYGVIRAGASFEPQQKLDGTAFDLSDTFDKDTKYKTGLTGEIGAGYDFGKIGRASCRERVCQYV